MTAWNRGQRIVVVVGLGVGLWFVGLWATVRGDVALGWVGYAPVSSGTVAPGTGLHPWVRLLIWLALTVVWSVASVAVLRTSGRVAGPDR